VGTRMPSGLSTSSAELPNDRRIVATLDFVPEPVESDPLIWPRAGRGQDTGRRGHDGGLMIVRIAIRRFAGDRLEHAYDAGQLDVPGWHHLVPACAVWSYPRRHPRDMLGEDDLPSFGSGFDRCPACAAWAEHRPHTVVVRGTVPAC